MLKVENIIIIVIKDKNKKANIIYIKKEDMDFIDIKNAKDLFDYLKSRRVKSAKNYIVIDEIQEIADFKIAICSLLLDENNEQAKPT